MAAGKEADKWEGGVAEISDSIFLSSKLSHADNYAIIAQLRAKAHYGIIQRQEGGYVIDLNLLYGVSGRWYTDIWNQGWIV